MASLTLVIAVSISAVVLMLSPAYALIAYIGALVLCPYYLRTELGTLNFPVHRIVILAVYASLLIRKNQIDKFNFIWPDKFVIACFACNLLAGVFTMPNVMQLLENQSGRLFDMALPYFAVRLIITNKQRYILFLKGVLCIAGILAIPAFYESVTRHNLFNNLFSFTTIQRAEGTRAIPKWGLYRAGATFGNAIQLGIFFAMAGGVCAGLLKNIRRHIWFYSIGIGLTLLGVLSSMSTGSFLAAIVTISFIAYYRYRWYWKQAIVTLVIMCAVVEIISNRHFYEVIDRVALRSQTAWYRSRLIEVAFFEGGMSGHWLFGYGLADPGWSKKIDGRSYTDMVNHYLLILSQFGLVGFIPFCGLIITSVKKLFEKFWLLQLDCDRWFVWSLAGVLFGLLITFNSVSIFPPCRNFFYVILGLCGALPQILYRDAKLELQRVK